MRACAMPVYVSRHWRADSSCLVPACDGVNLSSSQRRDLWDRFYTCNRMRLHAKTTHAIRGELQRSQASVASLARQYGINEKTVIKWRKRRSVEDMPMGPKERRSTVLSPMEEAAIVALRMQARLPLETSTSRSRA